MPSDALIEYCDLLRAYAVSGINYFNNGLKAETRRRIMRHPLLRSQLATREQSLGHVFSRVKSGKKDVEFQFIPMPGPFDPEFDAAFFVPRFRIPDDDAFDCAFHLLLWIDKKSGEGAVDEIEGNTLAYRLEPPGPGPHQYAHVQISRRVSQLGFPSTVPLWVPDSFPAFPIRQSTPMGFFVATITSVHGYGPLGADVRSVVSRAVQGTSAAGRAARLAQDIEALLRAPN